MRDLDDVGALWIIVPGLLAWYGGPLPQFAFLLSCLFVVLADRYDEAYVNGR